MRNDHTNENTDKGARSAGESILTTKKPSNRNQKHTRNGTTFKGETPSMHGNVFEVLGEKGIKNQFKETLEALERYAGETYPRETALMQPIFKRLENPILEPPKPPNIKKKKRESKIKTEVPNIKERERIRKTSEPGLS